MPTTTSDKISMVAKTGRRTQSWASVCMGYLAWVTLSGLLCLNCGAVEERVVGAGGDGLIAGKPVDDADLVALDFARDDDAEVGGIVVDGEDLVGIGGFVADHGVARHEDGGFAAGQEDAGGVGSIATQLARRLTGL